MKSKSAWLGKDNDAVDLTAVHDNRQAVYAVDIIRSEW